MDLRAIHSMTMAQKHNFFSSRIRVRFSSMAVLAWSSHCSKKGKEKR